MNENDRLAAELRRLAKNYGGLCKATLEDAADLITETSLPRENNRMNDNDEICIRCGAGEQFTHHPLCQHRDGTPTELCDELVRDALAIPEEEAIKQVALAAFMARVSLDDFLSLSPAAVAKLADAPGLSPAAGARAWQVLHDRECERMDRRAAEGFGFFDQGLQ